MGRRPNPPLIEHIRNDDLGTIIKLLVENHGAAKVLEHLKNEIADLETALDTTTKEMLQDDPLEEIHELADSDDDPIPIATPGNRHEETVTDLDGDQVNDEEFESDDGDTSDIEENMIAEAQALENGDKYGVFDEDDNLVSSWPTKAEAKTDRTRLGGTHYVDELIDGTV